MSHFHLLRVFCAEDGSAEPAGVFLQGAEAPDHHREAVAGGPRTQRTVSVTHTARPTIRIFTPAEELHFAAIRQSGRRGCSHATESGRRASPSGRGGAGATQRGS